MPTQADFDAIFARECANTYLVVDTFEQRCGIAVDPARLQAAARVLACPLKANPPNWQHGRVLYALVVSMMRRRIEDPEFGPAPERWNFLDVGTAKGFSALCFQWALSDTNLPGTVTSVDVLDPHECVRRNTVAEVDGFKRLSEILQPWPEAQTIRFVKSTGQVWLVEHTERIHAAFIDGKHSYDAVSWEAALLAERQKNGDVVLFDDAHISGVSHALKELRSYHLEYLEVKPERRYAIGVRK